jgi:hypothetical protein
MPAQQQRQQQPVRSAPRGGIDLSKAASDGFICSAGGATPDAVKLGTRYGNSNADPASVAAAEAAAIEAATPSGDTSQIPPQQAPINETIKNVAGQLEATQLGPVSKRSRSP